MEIVEFISKNGQLVSADDRAFNPEIEAALVKDGEANFIEKFRVKCDPVYEKVQRWKILTRLYDNSIHDYLDSVKGRVVSRDDNFEKVMRDEGLENLLGKVRIIKITFDVKEYTNGRDCEPCEC